MPLAPGTWLAHYEILDHIGSGGMGEVYRARDNKLAREVALKVLPKIFAQDPDRVARFRREAQVLASLNHPNIGGIYGVEEDKGVHFLVLELVLGDTLRDRLAKTAPLPLEEVLDIGKQIAEGLEHAHAKPIVHRDLKPANLKMTPEGKVKVLDFGLAKAYAKAGQPVDPADIPTGSLHGTLAGTVLGTPAYMSPEQASGKEVDKRADIWALGAVLFELLTGKHAFPGETVTEIIASVLKSDPDWTALPADTPPAVRSLLKRCLRKDLLGRFHDPADVRIAIEEILSASAESSPARIPRLLRRWAWQVGAGALALGIVVGGLGVWNFNPTTVSQPAARFTVALPPGERLAGLDLSAIAFSPDSTQLAYVAERDGIQQLFLRALDSSAARPIPGTEGAGSPFFSPDGQSLGFFSEGKLNKISVTGGAPTVLAPIAFGRGGSWGSDGQIIFSPDTVSGLWRVSAAGGTAESLTTLDRNKGEGSHRFPHHLPGGKAILFTVGTGGSWDDARIEMLRLDTGERKVLVQGGSDARYVPTEHIVYVRAGALMAVPFDLDRLEVTGPPFAVVEGIMQSTDNTGVAHVSFSHRGWLVYVPGGATFGERSLVWVDRKGAEQPLQVPPRPYRGPRISPDGQRLALDIDEGNRSDIWVYDIPRGTLTRLTFEAPSYSPLWTPDGNKVTFGTIRSGPPNLFWKSSDGSGVEERLGTSEQQQLAGSWSPDGQVLAFTEGRISTGTDIWVLSLKEDPSPGSGQAPSAGSPRPATGGSGQAGQERNARPFLQTPFNEVQPAFSPDGRWLAYASNESGRYEVYVQPFPGGGGKSQISTEGGAAPVWARNGRELFYRNRDKIMKVDITSQPTFRAARPEMLFERHHWTVGFESPNYDVSPDGQRFLMIKPGEQEANATQINVVLNWFEELKRRVPSGP